MVWKRKREADMLSAKFRTMTFVMIVAGENSMHQRLIPCVLVLSMTLCTGCARKGVVEVDEAPPSSPQAEPAVDVSNEPGTGTGTEESSKDSSLLPEVTIRLEDPGEEPRETLRYKFVEGRRERLVMDVRTTIDMNVMGMGNSMIMPGMRVVMGLTAEEVLPDGALRYVFAIDGAEVLDPGGSDRTLTEKLGAEMQKTVGVGGSAVVTPRGICKAFDFEAVEGSEAQQVIDNVRDSMFSLLVPFPEEPIGVGARWEAAQAFESQGIHGTQIVTYSLEERSGERYLVGTNVVQNVEPQDVALDGIPSGAAARLTNFESLATGSWSLELERLVPKSSSNAKLHMEMLSEIGEQSAKIEMSFEVHTTVTPGE